MGFKEKKLIRDFLLPNDSLDTVTAIDKALSLILLILESTLDVSFLNFCFKVPL